MHRQRTIWNPPNPHHAEHLEAEIPLEEPNRVRVRPLRARSALSRNRSPDVPFTWSLNPYRGCQHACAYCYARPTHQYLDEGSGTDFERHLYAKEGLLEVLDAELRCGRHRGGPVVLSGNTDPYQPIEARLALTRACLGLLLAHEVPVTIITKSRLVLRDLDLLLELHRRAGCRVVLSVPSLDHDFARALEPGASRPCSRIRTIARLAEAGIPTGVSLAPLVPALNDTQIPSVLRAAAEAGARFAFMSLLRLPPAVAPLFERRLRAGFPQRADRILRALREMRGGELDDTRFGRRMTGHGVRWRLLEHSFALWCRKLGLAHHSAPPLPSGGEVAGRQMPLPFEPRRPKGPR